MPITDDSTSGVYKSRNPKDNAFYNFVENHFEELESVWDKKLRTYFMYDRSVLGKLSKCAWNVTSAFLKSAVPRDDVVPGASIAVKTYGDFLNFNPHLHAVVIDGCFLSEGSFVGAPGFHAEDLKEAFQYEFFKMMKKEGKIYDAIIETMLTCQISIIPKSPEACVKRRKAKMSYPRSRSER